MSDPTQPPTVPTPVTPPPAAAPPVAAPVAAPPPGFAAAPPGYPPGTYPAPGAAAWGAAPAPQPTKRKSGVIIGAAVAAVALVGGTFAVINLTQDKKESSTPSNGGGVGVTIDPDDGPAPAPPSTSATVPGPTTPPTVVTTTLPPPTTSPPTTSTPTTVSTGGGDTQTVLGNIAVTVPSGWEVGTAADGFVALGTDGAAFYITALPFQGDASQLVAAYMQEVVSAGLENVTVDGEGPTDLPTSSVVSGHVLAYQAVLATQQGSVPVEGLLVCFITQDGIGVVMETFNATGDFESHSADYNAMINSVISTL